MFSFGQIEESCITLIPSSGGKGEPAHGIYALPNSTKIPVTIEWSSCNGTEAASILEQYRVLDSAPNAVRPRCLGFFEASGVGRIGFVFADRDVKVQLSLRDLIRLKQKPSAGDRGRLAHAVTDCIQRTSESTKDNCECRLWSGSIQFLCYPPEISVSAPFLAELAPPIVPPIHSDPERLLYLPPRMWDHQDPLRDGSIKKLGREIRWTLGIILLEISDWRTFRDILSDFHPLNEHSSVSDMSSAVRRFGITIGTPLHVVKSPKVDQVVRFCLEGEAKFTVPEYCRRIKTMILQE